ncbi:S66 family peptidase [Celerinatantimonas yamalensis]|uniref:S66 peptidase family protein n=1 Tax=Celerinatantimonas yamalensis TaxID=559956 RepID=A0ABW9G4M0_9GAMM
MIYPEPLRPGSRIAITAFSTGIEPCHERRFAEIVRTLQERGYDVIVGDCLKGQRKHVSAPKEVRAEELMRFLTDDRIDAIAPPWGGELAMELLPLLDFKRIAQSKPKWLFGFSDVSTLSVAIHSILGWASVHSSNLMDLISTNTAPLIANTLNYLETPIGGVFEQYSSDKYTMTWPKIDRDPLAFVVGESPTQWRWLNKSKSDEFISGRLIGGCWDTLIHLFETSFLSLSTLSATYEEGVLLYLENVEMSPCDLVRAIHSMQFRGVFDHINGLILGRNFRADSDNDSDLTYLEVLNEHLANKNIPVMYDVDIGHAPPNLTLINGSVARLGIVDGRGTITQWLV